MLERHQAGAAAAWVQTLRFPLLALAMLGLLAALWGGLQRLGWPLPTLSPALPGAHGPLMVCGFLGTLIGIERAVAVGLGWAYLAPLATATGLLALLVGLPAALLVTLGSLVLLAVFGVIVQRQPGLATVTTALGAGLWAVGNVLWLQGWPLFRVVPWWSGFLLLTIAGERLELSRMLALKVGARLQFGLALAIYLSGLAASVGSLALGVRLAGVGMLALAWWLWRYDLARRTVRRRGLTRYIAVCLLGGYAWLALGGVLSWRFGAMVAGPAYDAMLHAVFVGFVFSMIFGHAPVILPAVLGAALPYRSGFYLPLAVLHLSLGLRLAGDLFGWGAVRQWGGLVNGLAVVGFFAAMVYQIRQGRQEATD